jgi:hypothetical protein
VTVDGVWIGNWIYCTLIFVITINNNIHGPTYILVNYDSTHEIFTRSCLATNPQLPFPAASVLASSRLSHNSLSRTDQCSVMLLPTADVLLLPGSCPRRLATISRHPHTLTADCKLTGLQSVGRLNKIAVGPRQHSHSWFQSSRDFWPIFLFSPRHICVWEMGPPFRRGEGSAFQWRRYVCCTVVSARVYPRCHSNQVPMGTVHPLSLHYFK